MRSVLVRRSLRNMELQSVQSVLVVGAGQDPFRHLFPEAELYVRSDFVARPGRTDVVANGMALPFRDGSFECALATEVLEYIPQPEAFATELYRVLTHNGLALVTVPFLFQDHGDYWRPTKRGLGDLFRDFSFVRIFAQGNRALVVIDLLTTAFWPYPLLFPLRVFSNLLFLTRARFALRGSESTAPSGFFIVARK